MELYEFLSSEDRESEIDQRAHDSIFKIKKKAEEEITPQYYSKETEDGIIFLEFRKK